MVLFSCNGDYNLYHSFWFSGKEAFKMKGLKQFFTGFKKGMGIFGYGIAILINSALLLIVYLVGVALTSIFAKLFDKHFLDMNLSKERITYWSDLNLKKKPIGSYYRQF